MAKKEKNNRTDNEDAAASFDDQITALLDLAKERTEQLWPGVVGQLEIARHHIRLMMHPDDVK